MGPHGHGPGHGGGHHHGGGGRRHGGGGWWGSDSVVYVTNIADCPPGYEAIVHPDGTVVCTKIQARGVEGTPYDEAGGYDRFAHQRYHTTVAGLAAIDDAGDLRWNGPPEPYGVGVNYSDAAGPERGDYGAGETGAGGGSGFLSPPIVAVVALLGLVLLGKKR